MIVFFQKLTRRFALGLIWVYRYAISPHFPPTCRYMPTCSAYAYEAVQKHGICRGGFLALRRLLRCHPFHPGGYDPLV
ncbi:MAG: membrane protein insertion efficiency factor YidD [Treponema sp.]|nr:membrane protein insertion efficiency factor YidD [Treponema sp.]MDR0511678.1 membrane protein insertion efficiency factor YidD [Treponema sp.]